MSLVTIEQDAWNDLKGAISAVETDLKPVEEAIATGLQEVGAIGWNILTQDAQKLYNDFLPDLKQVGVNVQNANPGIDLASFVVAFAKAAIPVAINEGLQIAEMDWNIIATQMGWNLNIPLTAGNAGTLNEGEQNESTADTTPAEGAS